MTKEFKHSMRVIERILSIVLCKGNVLDIEFEGIESQNPLIGGNPREVNIYAWWLEAGRVSSLVTK